MLHGSVETGMRLEEKIRSIDSDFECMNMGEQIKNFSSNIYLFDNRDREKGNTLMRGGNKCTIWKIQSELRANLFHWCFLIILMGFALVTFFSATENTSVSSSVPKYIEKNSNYQLSTDLTTLVAKEWKCKATGQKLDSSLTNASFKAKSNDGSADGSEPK